MFVTEQEEWFVKILRKRRIQKMCELEMEDLINKIKACTEEEKRLILSQLDIEMLWDAVASEIARLKYLEENGKKLFGI